MRTLSEQEVKSLRERVNDVWDWKKYYWYPLMPTSRPDVFALDTDKFDQAISEEKVKTALTEIGITKVFNLRELGESEELDIKDIPYLYESESVIIDESMEWIIYCSHEQSVAFGGAKLNEKIKNLVPNWKELEW